jgi:hypothetical protein
MKLTYECLRCGYEEAVTEMDAPPGAVRYQTPRCWECLTEAEVAQMEADPGQVDEGTFRDAAGNEVKVEP